MVMSSGKGVSPTDKSAVVAQVYFYNSIFLFPCRAISRNIARVLLLEFASDFDLPTEQFPSP